MEGDIGLGVGEEVDGLTVDVVVTQIQVDSEVAVSSFAELDGVLVEDGELEFSFIADLGSNLAVLQGGGNLNLVVTLASVGGGVLELVGFEGTVNVIVGNDLVVGSEGGEGRNFERLSHFDNV